MRREKTYRGENGRERSGKRRCNTEKKIDNGEMGKMAERIQRIKLVTKTLAGLCILTSMENPIIKSVTCISGAL
jgi:hypothetical protein